MSKTEETVKHLCRLNLEKHNVRVYDETTPINDKIAIPLRYAPSKTNTKSSSSSRKGNRPDLKCHLCYNGRYMPIIIEAKGTKGRLEALDEDGNIKMDDFSIINFAINGALYYGNVILDGKGKSGNVIPEKYNELIIIGINDADIDPKSPSLKGIESKAYYIAEKNDRKPIFLKEIDLSVEEGYKLLADPKRLYELIDFYSKSEEERDEIIEENKRVVDKANRVLHQDIYDDPEIRNLFSSIEKMFLTSGIIISIINIDGEKPLQLLHRDYGKFELSDCGQIYERIGMYATKKKWDKKELILSEFKKVLSKKELWEVQNNETRISKIFNHLKEFFPNGFDHKIYYDFMGLILNSINDWVNIENDTFNDIVLTPRYITRLMAKCAGVNRNSHVWDVAMGTGGFLVSAVDIMKEDAVNAIKDPEELEEKINDIENKQIMGIEILENIYKLGLLNMLLINCGLSNIILGNSEELLCDPDFLNKKKFNADIFLLNPPYSKEGKGLIFVEKALRLMKNGRAAVLIQENAGSGQGGKWAAEILKKNTLIASIHMPSDIFAGKASVQTAIYVFEAGRPHSTDSIVKFIDFSNDGYLRQHRRKSSLDVNLKNIDHAVERYDELSKKVLGKELPKTNYYSKENGLYVEDTINLTGSDWTYEQHVEKDYTVNETDFCFNVSNFLNWKTKVKIKMEIA